MTNSDQDGVRFRRTQSVTRAEEIQAVEQKVRKSQPDKPYVGTDRVLVDNLHVTIYKEMFTGFHF